MFWGELPRRDRLIRSQASVKYYKNRGVSDDARLFGASMYELCISAFKEY